MAASKRNIRFCFGMPLANPVPLRKKRKKDFKHNLEKNDSVKAYIRVDRINLQKLANVTSVSVVKDFVPCLF